MYVAISRKNFKQNISEQELQTKYVIDIYVTECSGPCIAAVLLEQSDFWLQLTMGQKYSAFQSQHYDSKCLECESIWEISPYLDICRKIRNLCICHTFNKGSNVSWAVN